jgi:adenylate cyclase
MPCAWGARWHSLLIGQGWSTNREADSSEALRLAGRAIELDRGNALALATNAHLRSYLLHDYEAGLEGFEKALTVCPNHSLAWLLSAGTLSYIGDTKKAVSNGERGLRLSPFDRGLFYYYMFLMLSHYANGDYAEAMKWGRLSMNENPTYTATHRLFAASLVASGRTPEAQDVVHALLRLEPDFTLAAYARTRQPFREPKLRERFLDHLRRAGFPEG